MNGGKVCPISLTTLPRSPSLSPLIAVTLFPIRLFLAAFMMLLAWPFAFIASGDRDERVIDTTTERGEGYRHYNRERKGL
uniref:Uncharacterized protein n=1 Tax=Oncorhynchus tshawytscha TaxID=74940 RepID=A0AAZ3SCB9_ONCTS